MFWVLLGILAGVAVGALSKFAIPIEYARYTAVAIMAILDSVFGAWRAYLVDKYPEPTYGKEANQKIDGFSMKIFVSGLLFNTALASSITYLGDLLGLDLYLAALVAFTIRIFINMGTIRRILIKKYFK